MCRPHRCSVSTANAETRSRKDQQISAFAGIIRGQPRLCQCLEPRSLGSARIALFDLHVVCWLRFFFFCFFFAGWQSLLARTVSSRECQREQIASSR